MGPAPENLLADDDCTTETGSPVLNFFEAAERRVLVAMVLVLLVVVVAFAGITAKEYESFANCNTRQRLSKFLMVKLLGGLPFSCFVGMVMIDSDSDLCPHPWPMQWE